MIKKINYLIILIAIVGGVYFAVTKDRQLVFILKDISIVFSISALYIIQKLFKIKINDGINFIYILFIFIAHFLGVIVNLYSSIYWLDKFVHFASGIMTSLAAIYILIKNKYSKKVILNVLFIISFSMLIASCWEIFEYTASQYFNVDPQKVLLTGVNDTMGDLIVALLGSLLVSISYYFENKNNVNLCIKRFEKLI